MTQRGPLHTADTIHSKQTFFHLVCVVAVVTVLLLGAASPADAGRIESDLSHQLRGAWAVLMIEVHSDCAGYYNNNEANLSGVASSASRRFVPGELAKIDKINLKRSRLDLFLTLAEPVLKSHREGPFELFDIRECKVQLMIPIDRDLVRHGPASAILEQVAAMVETWPSLDGAHGSLAWNQRERAPFPDDYELTLARYQIWKAEQVNVAVANRIKDATEQSRAVIVAIQRDANYLDGFAAGVERLRSWDERDCDDLLDVRFSSVADTRQSKDHNRTWKDGYHDGQELVFSVELARRLEGCYIQVPSLPANLSR